MGFPKNGSLCSCDEVHGSDEGNDGYESDEGNEGDESDESDEGNECDESNESDEGDDGDESQSTSRGKGAYQDWHRGGPRHRFRGEKVRLRQNNRCSCRDGRDAVEDCR